LRGLRRAEIEALVEDHLPGATAEEVENLARALRSFGNAAAPVAQRALPGVIQGATAGAVAGPWGALIGGVVGGAASALGSRNQPSGTAPARAPAPRQAPTLRPPAPAPMPRATPAQPPRMASPPPTRPLPAARGRHPRWTGPSRSGRASEEQIVAAAARLLMLLARPEVQSALLSLLMGNTGRRSVRTAEGQVPVEALADALAIVTADLASAAGGSSRETMEYV